MIVLAKGSMRETSVEEGHLAGRAEVRLAELENPEQVREATRDAEAVIVTTNPLTAAHIAALGEGVRVIGRAGTGLDAIDLEAARARGIIVYHTPDYATSEVATHTLALILAVHRRLLDADRKARTDFTGWRVLTPIPPLDELTAGIVGGGRIGRAVVTRLLPFVRDIVVYDPYIDAAPDGVERVDSLDELLRRSSIVTLHMPLTPETRGMIGARELALMPEGAIVVNVSRGGLVDQGDLRAALESGRLVGAALDVLTTEPPRADDPILGAPRLLLTPHLAWYSSASERRVRTQVLDGVLACLAGEAPRTGRIAVDPRGAEVR
jgi:D-3-phosphoglycerate dehydrogenase